MRTQKEGWRPRWWLRCRPRCCGGTVVDSLLDWRAPWPSVWVGRPLQRAASAAPQCGGRLCRRCSMARLHTRPKRVWRPTANEGTKSPGGWTLPTRCSVRMRRRPHGTSLPSTTNPWCTAQSWPCVPGRFRLCQCSHRPTCAHACTQAPLLCLWQWAACLRTSRRSSALPGPS